MSWLLLLASTGWVITLVIAYYWREKAHNYMYLYEFEMENRDA